MSFTFTRNDCHHATSDCITGTHSDRDGTTFAFGGCARTDFEFTTAALACGTTAECQMTADARCAGVGRLHNNAATGRSRTLTREQ